MSVDIEQLKKNIEQYPNKLQSAIVREEKFEQLIEDLEEQEINDGDKDNEEFQGLERKLQEARAEYRKASAERRVIEETYPHMYDLLIKLAAVERGTL